MADLRFATKSDLAVIAAAAKEAHSNQNAFGRVRVGGTDIEADAVVDTLTLSAGSNVTITPDATGDSITIESRDTTYAGATTSADGLMTSTDKTKLDGIAAMSNSEIDAICV